MCIINDLAVFHNDFRKTSPFFRFIGIILIFYTSHKEQSTSFSGIVSSDTFW